MSKHDNNNLEDMQEWSENQYNPGHWTRGNIPPHMKRGNLGKIYSFFFILLGILLILPGLGMLIFDYPDNVGQKILIIIIGLVLATVGYRNIKL